MSETELRVARRESRGKNHNRRLRQQGLIPAVVYGGDKEPLAIQVERRTLQELLRHSESDNVIFLLRLEGTQQSRHTMIRDLEIDPIRREILHVDFQRVSMDEKVRVQVPIELVGIPEGVKNEDGAIDFVTREVEVECLPGSIPNEIEIDVSGLHVGQHLEIGALKMPAGVTLLEEPDRVIVSIGHTRAAVEEEAEADLLQAAPAEPELIGRVRDEKREDEED